MPGLQVLLLTSNQQAVCPCKLLELVLLARFEPQLAACGPFGSVLLLLLGLQE